MAPLRVLCVHGYRQNSASFREKTGALRKLLKKQVELVFVTAPHRVHGARAGDPLRESVPSSSCETEEEEDDVRGWWFSDTQARSFSAQQACEESSGLDESVAAVREAVESQGPFDGVLGFSQGAALVAMLCSLQEQKLEPLFHFRFAVLVAGFRSACAAHQRFYSATIRMPSLHVFGQEDRVIPEAMSRDLLPTFLDPQVLTHAGGHFVPAASAHRQTYQDFLRRCAAS
ncbi:esterase OVCA2 [Synchiropus splendidus]|uniref:esterase OVCA2 n=1 Tax=Synchiropus splendidus TaxID=270530 RepID=UPI00237D3EF2|nr:esterase OVCA2 [Synchiropus splendidus]XP_053703350.1 esterase OVCA2 [Synchiropus splendidus]XP_053703351.1 esterase OVCA2 [Synchiropus splendidus]